MNREDLYYKTVNKLLDAYNNGTLEHGDCYACAVGNICQSSDWRFRFITEHISGQNHRQILNGASFNRRIDESEFYKADKAINDSGYLLKELMKIEWEFELSIKDDYMAYTSHNKKKGQFIGLCAVLDALREIHEVDTQKSEESLKRLKTAADKFGVIA